MSNEQQYNELDEEIDILAYVRLLLSKWYWIALSCIICLFLAFLINRYATTVFQANSSIMIVEKEDALGSMSSLLKEFGLMNAI
mgnify:FL=1